MLNLIASVLVKSSPKQMAVEQSSRASRTKKGFDTQISQVQKVLTSLDQRLILMVRAA